MAWEQLIKDQVEGAFVILDDLAPENTYVSVDLDGSSYNIATGTVVRVDVTETGVPMVLARFRIQELDASIVTTTDFKVLIPANNLVATPKQQDRIHLADGRNFLVMRVLGVPGGSLHILQIRLTK